MQTGFTLAQLADPDIAEANAILRACVHCGFCTATCPTYVLLGDELDSPRGRIYLIKEMLEHGRPPSSRVVRHIDRCLSCLGCMTTCPSSVHYMHLVDLGRRRIAETFRRPVIDRAMRALLEFVLPHPKRFRWALRAARLARLFAPAFRGRLRALLDMTPRRLPAPSDDDGPRVFPAEGSRRRRVALLTGCVQRVMAPSINDATIRLLTRHGCEVVVADGAGCCGALTHHLGRERPALDSARTNIAAWIGEAEGDGLDAVIVNASGCGTQIKDYGFMLRNDGEWADRAARIAALARDVTEFLAELGLPEPSSPRRLKVAYQAACSLRHGQKIVDQPLRLLAAAGFAVSEPPEPHLCCGSAGTYNILQPAIARDLGARKAANLESVGPDVIASGNIGCIVQLAGATTVPVVHTVELLDWATGGPEPAVLSDRRQA